ncbi:hypothetical protein RchiOBHm_Chr3g0488251 [Rosa chinensis]|uniref:Uncharacterized protein n=1 Tax=Rosa chinensis TaxID=74649 RepID=A0A2P6RFP9_ROSCH|nr:hypothetical protein RchiOBHm_Chr3g0488251 [Rosa chinensis]
MYRKRDCDRSGDLHSSMVTQVTEMLHRKRKYHGWIREAPIFVLFACWLLASIKIAETLPLSSAASFASFLMYFLCVFSPAFSASTPL